MIGKAMPDRNSSVREKRSRMKIVEAKGLKWRKVFEKAEQAW